MGLLKKLFDWLGKFFGSKAGKITAKIMMGVGIGAGAGAGVEIGIAHKRNKRAERIKADAIKKHDEGRIKVERTLADLGEIKLAIYRSFGELADAIARIQQRPDYELAVDGVALPSFVPAEFKQLSMEIETVVGGLGGMTAGSLVGVATMGTGTILALAPGALLSGVVLCAMGAKMLQRSAENVKMAKQIARDVEAILAYYKELDKTAKRFYKSFLKVQEPYFKHIHKVQKITARKTDWEKFSKAERLAVKNAIAFAQLLNHMCSVQLVLEAAKPNTLKKVNTPEVDRAIADADNVREQMKKEIAA